MNTAIRLRPARPGDAPGIALMSRDLIESGLGWSWNAERVARHIRNRNTVTVVATVRDGKAESIVVGFAIMGFGEEHAHLALLAVHPAQRRLGIGRQMMDWLIESCYTAGIATIHLELRATNKQARRFYRAFGFSETAFIPGYYRGRETGLRMLRVLREPTAPLPEWEPPRVQ